MSKRFTKTARRLLSGSLSLGLPLAAALWAPSARAEEPSTSGALAPPEPPPPPPPGQTGEPTRSPADEPPPEFPSDAFLPAADDPRIPSFLRALRLGQDSLLLGAYLQPGFRYVVDTDFNEDDSDGFFFQNARLIGKGEITFWKKLGAGVRFDFDVAQGSFAVKDVYGTLSWDKDLVAMDVGQLKVPLGLAELQPEARQQFAVASAARKIMFGRDLGIQLRSDFPIGPVWFRLAGMIANGEGGFRQRINLDNQFLYAGRLEIAPLGRMQWSESELDDTAKPQLTAGFSAGHNSALGNELGIADAGAGETRIGGDLRFWWRGLSIRGEYLHAFRGDNDGSLAFERYAATAQIGYVLPIPIPFPKFEIVSRFTQYDLNRTADGTEGDQYVPENTEARVLEFGANAYVAKHATKVSFLYQLTDLLEGPMTDENGDVLIGDTVYVVTQFAWL
ncbi:MAG: hypothetical protein IPG04_26900 [Polyangiaceae bacterium]|nr:hypothetical protein [Polyangiaceae bacterium]